MTSGLRPVQLIENTAATGDREQADHVVGVDESGNTSEGAFVLVAVQCPRRLGEQLVELLIEQDLQPWISKSSSPPEAYSQTELSEPIASLLTALEDEPITWEAKACWGVTNSDCRAATACIAATQTLVRLQEYDGNAVLLYDGKGNEFGDGRIKLRRAASRQFKGFGERHTSVCVACLESGDLIYPEITAADYIAGYIKSEIERLGSIEGIGWPVDRIDSSWSTPSDERPNTEYQIRTRSRQRRPRRTDRAAAWIEGRQPPSTESWGDMPLEALANRLQSETVKEYILKDL